jgi:prolyl oligopeptidase
MLERKQNVFDDFTAAAEWLVQNSYTNPKQLAITGGSNGGLLVGAAAVQRPDLFSAVVCDVPLLDMIRYHGFLMARYWVPEYGSSEDPKQFAYLLKYSPYQNVKPGVKYPAMLITAGENDKRVHPLHARKMAARLQASTTSDPTKEPILLWVEREAGHGAGKPLHLRLREMVDEQIFLMWQLGAMAK